MIFDEGDYNKPNHYNLMILNPFCPPEESDTGTSIRIVSSLILNYMYLFAIT